MEICDVVSLIICVVISGDEGIPLSLSLIGREVDGCCILNLQSKNIKELSYLSQIKQTLSFKMHFEHNKGFLMINTFIYHSER